jgi:hypothetical protein
MLNVVPFIQTVGTDKFRELISKPFTTKMLCDIDSDNVLFNNWKHRNMLTWDKYYDDETILEFYPNEYNIKSNTIYIKSQPIPLTVNDFINDMYKYKIKLTWSKWVDINYEPVDILDKNEIKSYYKEMLKKIEKSFELL